MKWLKSLIALGALVCGAAHAFAPQAGSWVIPSEINGQPGRGFVIDVQNGLFGLQMYAYESSGQPTFYLAVGQLVNNAITTPLHRYVGGRYLGSGPRSGTETASPGNVSLRFTSSTDGFIALPGEPEVAISRYEFGYTQGDANNLMGGWLFAGVGQSSDGSTRITANDHTDLIALTTNVGATSGGSGLVTSSNGTFGCQQFPPQVTGQSKWLTQCIAVLNAAATALRYYQFPWAVNEGQGVMGISSNGGVTTSYQGAVMVRRVSDSSGSDVEFTRELPVDDAAGQAAFAQNVEQLKQAMSQVAAQMLKRQSD
jgi:hypothetical protein